MGREALPASVRVAFAGGPELTKEEREDIRVIIDRAMMKGKLTTNMVSKEAGNMSRTTITKILHGEPVEYESVKRIARVLGVERDVQDVLTKADKGVTHFDLVDVEGVAWRLYRHGNQEVIA